MSEGSNNKKAVVTGGAGFIGSHIVDLLIKEGYDVHAIDDLSGGSKDNLSDKATLHQKDVRDYEAIADVIKGAEIVFHTAAMPRVQVSIENPLLTNDVNVGGTVNVLTAVKEGGVKRVVYSASSSAYGDADTLPLHEDLPTNPKSPYGLQKYIGELYCRTWSAVYGVETVSLRYFNVYGPRMNPDGAYALAIGKFLKQRVAGEPITITGDGTQTRDFTYVTDVARANILAATSDKVGAGEVINIGAGHNYSINEVAEMIGGPVEYIAPRLEPHDTLASNERAEEMIGWWPEVTLERGMAELKELFGLTG